jgi:hypothetical protein
VTGGTLQPCPPILIEPEATEVPVGAGISIRRHRGYLTYTRFGTVTSAFWYNWLALYGRLLPLVDQLHDAIPHYVATFIHIAVRVADDFYSGTQLKAVKHDA